MNRIFARSAMVAIAAISLAGCSSASSQFRLFPPDAADKNVNNAAYYVRQPYGDDCWQYNYGCAPPGVNPNIRIGGPYPNPARPVYVVENVSSGPGLYTTRRISLRHAHYRYRYRHRRPGLVSKG